MDIQIIHEQVFKTLLEEYEKNPDDFFFTLRRNNNSQRLEKGYWFHGNDWYLSVSFWSGMDWKNKTPNIYLNVNHEGGCHMFFSAKDDVNKRKFAMKKVFPLLEELVDSKIINGALEIRGDVISLAFNRNDHYSDVLIKFLKHIKPVIDNAIRQKIDDNASYYQSMQEYNERDDIQGTQEIEDREEGYKPINFIWPAEFKKSLDHVQRYRNQFLRNASIEAESRLSRIKIRDVGDIRQDTIIEIPDGCNWVFLTGENGCGKTTILKAITAVFFLDKSFASEFIMNGEVAVELDNGNKDLSSIPFAAYGPSRLISSYSENIVIDDRNSEPWYSINNSNGILRGLNELHKVYNGNKKVLQKIVDNLEGMVSYAEKGAEDTLIDSNKGELFPQLDQVDFKNFVSSGEVQFFEKDNDNVRYDEPKSFDQLASGVKSQIALISDMIVRFLEKQPEVPDFAEFKGVVLIDEIDLHFHPSMQKRIIEILSDRFPKIQFIVTTHSPIPFLGAPEKSIIYRISRSSEGGVKADLLDIDVTELNPNLILSSPIFGFSDLLSSNLKEGFLNTQDLWFEKKTQEAKLDVLLEKYKERKNRQKDDQQEE